MDFCLLIAPRAPMLVPPAQAVFDIDESLRRMGLARQPAVVLESENRWARPKERGELTEDTWNVDDELVAVWRNTPESCETAGFLFGNPMGYDGGVGLDIRYRSGPGVKVVREIEGNHLDVEPEALASQADDEYLPLEVGKQIRLSFGDTLTSPVTGEAVPVPDDCFRGVYRVCLELDFLGMQCGLMERPPFPRLPEQVHAELVRAFCCSLVQAGLWQL